MRFSYGVTRKHSLLAPLTGLLVVLEWYIFLMLKKIVMQNC